VSSNRRTEILEELRGAYNSDGAFDVFIQDQTSPLFQNYLIQEQKTDIKLTSAVSVDDNVINVTAGHGFTAASGVMLNIREGNKSIQAEVIGVATNAITIDLKSDYAFSLSARVIRGNKNMNVDGSSADVEFKMTMCQEATIPIDISKVIISMQHGANVPDDAKFGGLTALTNGVYFRKVNSSRINLGNYKNNKDFIDLGAVVTYSEKAPAGTNGTNIVFNIKDVFGQVIRIDPRVGEYLIGVVRDDIAASEGMAGMTCSIIGSLTEGE
jgi:hypothetical protein